MTRATGWKKYRTSVERSEARYIIEGVSCPCAKYAYGHAVKNFGCTIPESTFYHRLAAGLNTWAALSRPSDQDGVSARRNKSCEKARQRKADEMAEAIAALDQRKRDMGLA